ncbi:AraC family transcriptional regulator [Pedobacter heparinus]|uniref:helix-turn-helix domain-containing protein n=1 Tax=Pedobacter heparinus TaxID=984 RepID=UPI00292F4A2C|nr:AraC family transcriptional regulator [Pedobacter heparinus]
MTAGTPIGPVMYDTEPSPGAFKGLYVSPVMLMEQLDALINEHFREEKSPDFYSSALAHITRTLNNITHQERGKTVFAMVQDRVLAEAQYLLRTTRMHIRILAFILGFEDPGYFSRFFKRMTGMTPKQYRINSRTK